MEAEAWPKEWKICIVIPLWKRKGKKTDRNTYRGITLLSIGSKIVARIAATRVQKWSDPWIHETQCGFRSGRGVDDVLQVSSRVIEEVVRSTSDEWVLTSFFDIEKAYPRICKDALWKLLDKRGCPSGFIKILKAFHEHTMYQVRFQGEFSEVWLPDRGLREGCPTSPGLFNIYHDAVMEDFRKRREKSALEQGKLPGLCWHYKVDGRMVKKGRQRRETDSGKGWA